MGSEISFKNPCVCTKFKLLFKTLNTSLLKVFMLKLVGFPARLDWNPTVSSIGLRSWEKSSWFLLRNLLFWVRRCFPFGFCSLSKPHCLFWILLRWIVYFFLIDICSSRWYLCVAFNLLIFSSGAFIFCCCLSSLVLLVSEMVHESFSLRCLLCLIIPYVWSILVFVSLIVLL